MTSDRSTSPAVTIAIATYNRAEEVRATLLSIYQHASSVDHEIIVVANCCTDQTCQVVREFIPMFAGRLRLVEEPSQGLSHARNRAIAEARSPILAFLDDDVNLAPGWLDSICNAFADTSVAVAGGRARLAYPFTRPAWLDDDTEGYLTKVELGDQPRDAGKHEIYGVNIAFRREWFSRVGGFRPDLGRKGHSLIGGEEGEIMVRINSAGGRLVYWPAAAVEHRVPTSRLRRRWFWRRAFDGNRGEGRNLQLDEITAVFFLRTTWRVARAAFSAIPVLLSHGPRSAAFFNAILRLCNRAGSCAGMYARLPAKLQPASVSRSGRSEPAASVKLEQAI